MKEKRAPSRSLSLWFYLGLLLAVFMSCGLIGWFGVLNPITSRIHFSEQGIYWDTANEKLSFFTFGTKAVSPGIYYSLDRNDQLKCEWTSGKGYYSSKGMQWWEDPVHSLTNAQLTSLENRFGKIKGYDVVADDVLVLITSYQVPLDDLYGERLIVIKNGNPDTALIMDVQTLYKTRISCHDDQRYFILNAIVLMVSVAIAVKGIRKLRHKNLWLFAFVILLLVGFVCGYFLALGDDAFLGGK
jgi:hypothetical protein